MNPKKIADAVESQEISDSSWKISFPRTTIATLEELLAYCKVDLDKWKVRSFKINKWESAAKLDPKTIKVTPLFQVYAILEPNPEISKVVARVEELKKLALSWSPRPTPLVRTTKGKHLLELSISDHHLGKLAWDKETGWGNYDSKIALSTFEQAVETLIDRTKGFAISKILLPLGNDFFHVDSSSNTTTSGTQVDVDSRFKKTYVSGRELLCHLIERLRKIAPIDVVMVAGNHDRSSNFTLGDSLWCFFRHYTDVSIDNRPLSRKYYQFGRTLLGLTHGDEVKREDLHSLMPVEAPFEFAQSTWREWHTGHLHRDTLTEKHGIRVRVLPSLCAADAWHAGKGFVGNIRSAQAFVWHPEECLVSQAYFSIPELRPGQQELMKVKRK